LAVHRSETPQAKAIGEFLAYIIEKNTNNIGVQEKYGRKGKSNKPQRGKTGKKRL
jgi:hypothetical protein